MKKLNLYNCDGGNQRTEAKSEERITKQKKKNVQPKNFQRSPTIAGSEPVRKMRGF